MSNQAEFVLFALSVVFGILALLWSKGSSDRADKYRLSVIVASSASMVLLFMAVLNHSGNALGSLGFAFFLYAVPSIFRR
jgi:hypothetical protein